MAEQKGPAARPSTETLLRPADWARHATVWSHRSLLRALVSRNITLRYRRSTLGFFWALLNPLLTVAILVGVFAFVFRVGVADYWAFLIAGYFAWIFVVHTVSACATTIREHANIVRNAAFPSEILVISVTISRSLELILELVLAVVVVSWVRHGAIPSSVVMLPVLLVMLFAAALALSLPVAAASVFYHDVQFALPVSLSLLGYLTPVFYPISFVPEGWRTLLRVNPMVDLITFFHTVIYDGVWPDAWAVLRNALVIFALLWISIKLFRWKHDLFAEVV